MSTVERSGCTAKQLGSVIQQDEEIDEDVTNRRSCGWLRCRTASGMFCDLQIPLSLKEKFYGSVVKLAML